MSALERALAAARRRPRRVVFPEREDARISAAAQRLETDGLAVPVWLEDAGDASRYARRIAELRPRTTEKMAMRLLRKPLYLACAMVAAGEADAVVAGAATPTRRVIEAASMTIGPGEGVGTISSFFLMEFPDGREIVFADCAVNVAPVAAALADIAAASARSAQALFGEEPRIAMLSYSTLASGSGPSVERVAEAVERSRARLPGIVGPVQADAALSAQIAARKGLGSGDANVLIFPSLDAGNIAYKLCQELAGAKAMGPFLQGFARPVCDLSRGATVDDIVASTVVALAMA